MQAKAHRLVFIFVVFMLTLYKVTLHYDYYITPTPQPGIMKKTEKDDKILILHWNKAYDKYIFDTEDFE